MYRVVIADDEKIIRMGLRSIIDWEAQGFTIVGEASNGSEVLRAIEDYAPDVTLIDIRMPRISGLDAIKTARESGFSGRFIVLSGYSDFEYAQTAINYNVTSYLTKPVDTDKLIEVLARIKDELDAEEEARQSKDDFMSKARKQLLRGLLTGELKLSDNEKNDLNLNHRSYQVIFCEKYSLNAADQSYNLSDLLRVTNQNETEIENISLDGRNVILLKGNHPIEKLNLMIDKFSGELPPEKNSPLDSIFIACGSVVSEADEISRSYNEALEMLLHRFFSDKNQHTMLYSDYHHTGDDDNVAESTIDTDNIKTAPVDINDTTAANSDNTAQDISSSLSPADKQHLREEKINEYSTLLVNNIQVFNRNKIAETLKKLQDELYSAPLSIRDEKDLLVDIYLKIKEKLMVLFSQTEIPFMANSEAISFIMNSHYLHEIVLFLTEQFDMVMTSIGYSSRDSIIDDVIYYIEHNYQSNITLENIAPLFGYNSSYLGKIFSKKLGTNFNSYLDNVRVDHAKEILLGTKIQVYKVAEMVGYKNVDYFHIKFKKNTGISPAEYRKQNV